MSNNPTNTPVTIDEVIDDLRTCGCSSCDTLALEAKAALSAMLREIRGDDEKVMWYGKMDEVALKRNELRKEFDQRASNLGFDMKGGE